MRTGTTGAAAAFAAAGIAFPALAGSTGWIASVRAAGTTQTFVDVFAGFNASTDRLLNVYYMNIALSGAAFVQAPEASAAAWKPTDQLNSASYDSFVALGGYPLAGHMYASATTAGDPSFTNYAVAGATSIASNAGWYTTDPTNTSNRAADLATLYDFPTGSRDTRSADGAYGTWVAHLLVNKAITDTSWSLSFTGWYSFNSGTQTADARIFHAVPAPGAVGAILAAAGFCRGHRRRPR